MKRYLSVLLHILMLIHVLTGQEAKQGIQAMLFRGIVMSAETKMPLSGTQIMINRAFASISDTEGKFAFYVNRLDTVKFSMLGYKSTILHISDTLQGYEFIAGIYMNTDTLSIDEIVIMPGLRTLKSDLLRPAGKPDPELENARYNLEVSAYQGKITQSKLGDPDMNYKYLQQKYRAEVYSKGQIPSDRIIGLSPFMVVPAVYLLMNGFPGKPPSIKPHLSDYELNMIYKKYLETYGKK
ncbi:MAG TPA: hypothetical protein PLO24_03825 [Bacteroidales bacterium]|nr:hypothetical protein [Bacteroidales bacterium]HOS71884.1 hypothetical protein [Bacteroidales bacterium]HQH22820.1 hypothetical protein [Bacteroidales bacterium]HQJ81714.1 hypothetical protein [Bacteroidales bacterium]